MANPQARQKKLEKKRLRRKEKRRALRLADRNVAPPWRPLPKMSDSLEELIEPLFELVDPAQRTVVTLQNVLSLGAMAWNLSLNLDGDELAKELDLISHEAAGTADPADFRAMVQLLVDRKRALFPADQRIVVDAAAYENENGLQLFAASTMLPRS